MNECVFCKIINKEQECYRIYESDTMVSFLDHDPIHEGHVLIVPKIHRPSIDQIPLSILNDMMALSQKVVSALMQIYKSDGYGMMQNGGEFCDFGHFHLHIFPRYRHDGFGWTYPPGSFECSWRVAKKIIEHL